MDYSETRNIGEKNWRKGLGTFGGLTQSAKNKIVFEHLQNNGFQHIAETFKEETELGSHETAAFQQEYAELKDLILKNMLSGKFEVVREILKSQFPDFFKKNANLKIELQILEFVQLVRKSQTDAAIQFARRKLVRHVEEDAVIKPKLRDRIKRTLTLLAFRETSKFPEQALVNSGNVFRISHKINNKISVKQKVESNLEKRQKFIEHFQDWLISEKWPVPIVTHFAPLKLMPPKADELLSNRQGSRTVLLISNNGNVYVD